jgi:hypothetical protein
VVKAFCNEYGKSVKKKVRIAANVHYQKEGIAHGSTSLDVSV